MIAFDYPDYSTIDFLAIILDAVISISIPLLVGVILRYLFDRRPIHKEKSKWPRFLNNVYPISKVNHSISDEKNHVFDRIYLNIIIGFIVGLPLFFLMSVIIFIIIVILIKSPIDAIISLDIIREPFLFVFLNFTLLLPLVIHARIAEKKTRIVNSKKHINKLSGCYSIYGLLSGIVFSFLILINLIIIPEYIEYFDIEVPGFFNKTILLLNYIMNLPQQELQILLVIHFSGVAVSLFLIKKNYSNIVSIYKKVKNVIVEEERNNFPYLRIKTYSDEIEGKVENAFDEETLILNDRGIKKAVSWDRIEYIEIIEHTKESPSNQKYLHDFV
jgi:hypothetical protein